MKRFYFLRPCWFLPGILVGMVLLFASAASAQTPSIEGTYQLISRQLPDGKVLKPPDIMGLQTYTKSHRNFNLVLKDATGKFSSISAAATYKLTATEYQPDSPLQHRQRPDRREGNSLQPYIGTPKRPRHGRRWTYPVQVWRSTYGSLRKGQDDSDR